MQFNSKAKENEQKILTGKVNLLENIKKNLDILRPEVKVEFIL